MDRRVFRELLSAGYGLLPGRLLGSVVTLPQGFRGGQRWVVSERKEEKSIGPMILCAAVVATLLVIRGVELNPGPVESIVQVLCSGCDRNLKSGTQCESCGWWYHNSCGNVKFQVAESGKWNCDRCRSERLWVLEQKLRNAQIQI